MTSVNALGQKWLSRDELVCHFCLLFWRTFVLLSNNSSKFKWYLTKPSRRQRGQIFQDFAITRGSAPLLSGNALFTVEKDP